MKGVADPTDGTASNRSRVRARCRRSIRFSVLVFVLFAIVCVGATAGSAADAQQDPYNGSVSASIPTPDLTSDAVIEFRKTVRPSQSEAFRFDGEIEYVVPETVSRLTIPHYWVDGATVTTTGFEHAGDGTFVRESPGDGRILIEDTLSIALAELPDRTADDGAFVVRSGGGWDYYGPDPWGGLSLHIEGEETMGEYFGFVGEYETYEREATDESFRLVVPEVADLSPDPDRVLDSLETASATLDVEARNDDVLLVVVPTQHGFREDSVAGKSIGSEIYVMDASKLPASDGGNTWVHEYVHTRQIGGTSPETRWLVEATASYYDGLSSFEQAHVSFGEFQQYLDHGTDEYYDDVVLSERDTWTPEEINPNRPPADWLPPDYTKGPLVVGALDYEIRTATDGEATFEDVFREWNRRGTLDQERFESVVEEVAGPDVRSTARTYTTTNATPSTWTKSEHAAAFGLGEPQVQSLASVDDRVEFGPVASVDVNVTVTNPDDTVADGPIEIVDATGSVLETLQVTLAPNETRTLSRSVRVDGPGERTLRAQNRSTTVDVVRSDGDEADGGSSGDESAEDWPGDEPPADGPDGEPSTDGTDGELNGESPSDGTVDGDRSDGGTDGSSGFGFLAVTVSICGYLLVAHRRAGHR